MTSTIDSFTQQDWTNLGNYLAPWQQGWGPFEYKGDPGNVNNLTDFRWTTPDGTAPAGYSNPIIPKAGGTADSSAKAIIDTALSQYGLSTLSAWAWSKWQSGEGIDQI